LGGEAFGDRFVGELGDVGVYRCEVEEGAFDGRRAQPVASGYFIFIERRESVEAQAVAVSAVRRNGDVDRCFDGHQAVRREPAGETQDFVGFAGHHSGGELPAR
jgi:hypothetical protein